MEDRKNENLKEGIAEIDAALMENITGGATGQMKIPDVTNYKICKRCGGKNTLTSNKCRFCNYPV